MNKAKFFISLVLALSVLIGQVGGVLAAPISQASDLFAGIVKSITLEIDPHTGITTALIEVTSTDQGTQTLRIGQETAISIGLVALNGDGNLVINKLALGKPVEIDPATVIPNQQESRHPLGNALTTFFSDVPGVDYETIMASHDKGVSFGVIAQALWLTKQLGGDYEVFEKLLTARETGDYSDFDFDGVTPKNWGQLRKAILDSKKVDKPGNPAADQNNGNSQNNKDKDKNKDRDKNKGNDKRNNGNRNDENKDKNKDK
ncbi:MAG TPA: hypothetical protein VFQ13_16005 [Anaerolineales bacterium]|nr:hypothetical protein [Anaerolineales bacterium]